MKSRDFFGSSTKPKVIIVNLYNDCGIAIYKREITTNNGDKPLLSEIMKDAIADYNEKYKDDSKPAIENEPKSIYVFAKPTNNVLFYYMTTCLCDYMIQGERIFVKRNLLKKGK